MPEEERLDVAAAAEQHDCSTKMIWRHIKDGSLPARTEKVDGRYGRPVLKTSIRVADLKDAFGWTVHEDHVRSLREAAPLVTVEQKSALGSFLLDHIRDRDAQRGGPEGTGSST